MHTHIIMEKEVVIHNRCSKCGSKFIYFTNTEVKCRNCGYVEPRRDLEKKEDQNE